MNFLTLLKRPILIIIVGVFFIGLGIVLTSNRPPSQTGENLPDLSELIIPTPVLNITPNSTFPGENSIPDSTPELKVFIQSPISSSRFPATNRAVYGSEPITNPMLEKINAAGKEYPVWIIIPSISLSAPVVFATMRKVLMEERTVDMWFAPDYEAAGWHTSSAFPGEVGNLVMSGHNNDYGHIFGHLIDLKQGDEIQIITQKRLRSYTVANIVLFQEVEIGLEKRMENARWISPSPDERLTLVTCWPNDSNTHRLVIVASPN